MTRWLPWFALTFVVVAVAHPMILDPPPDDFPLSSYPMFTTDRTGPSAVPTAVGLTTSGERHRLSPSLLAGADEPILAVRTAREAVGADRAEAWCEEIADRVAEDATIRNGAPVAVVEVVTELHDAVATMVDDAPPLDTTVHAACVVPTS